jgi:hypothetical protein
MFKLSIFRKYCIKVVFVLHDHLEVMETTVITQISLLQCLGMMVREDITLPHFTGEKTSFHMLIGQLNFHS